MEYRVDEIVEINKNSLKKANLPRYIKYLETANITKGKIDNIVNLDTKSDDIPSRARRLVQTDDIIISTVRPNQEHYGYIEDSRSDLTVSTGFVVLTPRKDLINPYYLYLTLTTDQMTRKLQSIAEDSTSAYPSIKPSVIGNQILKLPSMKTQNSIATFFSNIDNKIEVNNKLIANLTELSQTFFKRWFVDFEFPDEKGNPYKSNGGLIKESSIGKLPKYWKVISLSELSLSIHAGGTPSRKKEDYWDNGNIPWLKTKEIKNNIIVSAEEFISDIGLKNSSAKWIKGDSVVMAMYGATAGSIGYLASPMTSNQACCAFETDFPIFTYLYLYNNQDYIKSLASGSAQQNLNKKTLEDLQLGIPDLESLWNFEVLVNPIFNQAIQLVKENNDLTNLRDTLLPKLMSGEIELPDELEVDEHAELLQ